MQMSQAKAAQVMRPDFQLIVDRLRVLRPEIAAIARQTEKDGRVPASTFDKLRDADVFRVMQPARFGGYEYGPAELATIGFEIGQACGSTGWCATLAVCFQWMVGFFPLEAQEEVFADPDNLLAVSYTPTRAVTKADGGYNIAGAWQWASGCDGSTWLILSAFLPNEAGPPALAWCLVPTKSVVIDHASWNSSGMQGSGSKTVTIADPLFVPNHRILMFSDTMGGTVPGKAVPGNVMANFGYPTFGPTALVAPILGMAQGALDSFADTAAGATRMARPGVFVKVAESALIQSRVGMASARIDAALHLMVSSLRDGADKVRAGTALSVEERVTIRRNHGFACRTAVDVVNDIFAKSGAQAADTSQTVQRFWRDANAAGLHASLDYDMLSSMWGMKRLGLEPLGIF